MRSLKSTILIISTMIFSILDVSFFSNIPIKNASIISVFQMILIFAIIANLKAYFLFVAFAIIFFSIFSSLPVWLIFVLFFLIPSAILFLRKNYLPFPSVLVAPLFFIVANVLFEIILLAYMREWNREGFKTLYNFVIINSLFGMLVYCLYDLYLKKVIKNNKIKNL